MDDAEKADPVDGVDPTSGVLVSSCLVGVTGAECDDDGAATALFMDRRGLAGVGAGVGAD